MVDRVVVPAEEGLTHTPADNATSNTTERPSWLPENFNDTEDLWKSYQELRKDHTKKSQALAEAQKAKPGDDWQKPGDEPPEEPKSDEKKSEEKKSDKPVDMEQAKQLLPGFSETDIQDISNYAWENGELTPEHYSKLEKAGYSKEIVDQFMQGQFAVVEGQKQALINAGGGQQRVDHMFQWAAQNLSQAEIAAYDSKFDMGGADAMLAMESLVSKYERSGQAIGPSMMQGANSGRGDGSVFRSTAQVVEAMNDPRYKSDPAYRKSVAEKIARSKVL